MNKSKEKFKNIHFIGIAGSAIAPLAIMIKKKGFNVTGSEHNKVWDPAKTLLKNNEIKYTELEYDMDNIKDADLVVIGGSALLKDQDHPEFLKAKELNKKIVGYAYIIDKFIAKEKSIVVTGSYGKSTITSILIWVLKKAGMDPSFMVGGKPIGLEKGVQSTDGEISVVEGDEYASAWGFDMEPRFVYYNPTHAIVTSAEWDHLDVYTTEQSYIEAFRKLTSIIQKKDGFLLINEQGENISKVIEDYDGDLVSYSTSSKQKLDVANRYYVDEINYNAKLTKFSVYKNTPQVSQAQKIGDFETILFGRHNVENLLAAIVMCCEINIDLVTLQQAIRTFKGIKRRLDVLGKLDTGAILIDDFAHSPVKAKATLRAVSNRYPKKQIIGVYKPRPSIHQTRDVLSLYPGVFDAADQIFITKIVQSSDTKDEDRIRGKDLIDVVQETQPNVRYVVKETIIANYLNKQTDSDSIVVLMSAASWDDLLKDLNFTK
jgi:UDP-N-acetylmuramate: L-alanyl-gamma-D-glutamyl-meso-diaminopimelate ligase